MTATFLRSAWVPSIDVSRHGNVAAKSAYREIDTDSSGPSTGQFNTEVWQHAEEQGTGY
jgi:hypothetical protein